MNPSEPLSAASRRESFARMHSRCAQVSEESRLSGEFPERRPRQVGSRQTFLRQIRRRLRFQFLVVAGRDTCPAEDREHFPQKLKRAPSDAPGGAFLMALCRESSAAGG